MDNFLASLYEEEQTKIAAADLGYFMNTLPVDELEEFLGLTKMGVAGPAEGELPDSENGELDKAQKRVDVYAAKVQGQEPPTRKESEEASAVNYQGPGKEAAKEAMVRRIQKIAASGCMTKTDEFTSPEAKKKAKLLSTTLKMGKGQPVAARKKAVSVASKMKVSQGIGDMGAGGAGMDMGSGGVGGMGMGMGSGGMGGMETTAAMKAKIAMRAIKVTAGAPPHVKQAAARLAGLGIAKLAKKEQEYTVVPGGWLTGQKAMSRASTVPGATGISKYIADPQLIGERQLGSTKGALKGGGIGLGAGALIGGGAALLSRGRIPLLQGAGLGAGAGGLMGVYGGQIAGLAGADKKFLAARGVKLRGLGFGRPHLTEQAAQKYLTDEERAKAMRLGGV